MTLGSAARAASFGGLGDGDRCPAGPGFLWCLRIRGRGLSCVHQSRSPHGSLQLKQNRDTGGGHRGGQRQGT